MATFDKTFDNTFGGRDAPITAVDLSAYKCGFQVMFLTSLGWAFWLFEAYTDTKLNTKSIGSFSLDNLVLDTRKLSTPVYVIRTGALKQLEAQKVASILSSSAVYWLRENANGQLSAVRIRVETDSLTVWEELAKYGEIELTVSLPYTKNLPI